jgi:hypothetical protein
VAVDFNGVPAKRFGARRINFGVMFQHGRAALSQAVHVDDGDDIIQLVVIGDGHSFPHAAFSHFAVAENDPHAIRQLVEKLAGERIADAHRQALTQRTGRGFDPRNIGRGVAFEAAAQLAQRQQLFIGDGAGSLIC